MISASLEHSNHLTNRWSQPLAAVRSTFDLMKQFSVFATLAPASLRRVAQVRLVRTGSMELMV